MVNEISIINSTNELKKTSSLTPPTCYTNNIDDYIKKLKDTKILGTFVFNSDKLTEENGNLILLFSFSNIETFPPFSLKIQDLITGEIQEFKGYKDTKFNRKMKISNFKISLVFEITRQDNSVETVIVERVLNYSNCLNLKSSKYNFEPFTTPQDFLIKDYNDLQILYDPIFYKKEIHLYYNTEIPSETNQPYSDDNLGHIYFYDSRPIDLKALYFKLNDFGTDVFFKSDISKYVLGRENFMFRGNKIGYFKINEYNFKIEPDFPENRDYLYSFFYNILMKTQIILIENNLNINNVKVLIKNPLNNFLKGFTLNDDVVVYLYNVIEGSRLEKGREII